MSLVFIFEHFSQNVNAIFVETDKHVLMFLKDETLLTGLTHL